MEEGSGWELEEDATKEGWLELQHYWLYKGRQVASEHWTRQRHRFPLRVSGRGSIPADNLVHIPVIAMLEENKFIFLYATKLTVMLQHQQDTNSQDIRRILLCLGESIWMIFISWGKCDRASEIFNNDLMESVPTVFTIMPFLAFAIYKLYTFQN